MDALRVTAKVQRTSSQEVTLPQRSSGTAWFRQPKRSSTRRIAIGPHVRCCAVLSARTGATETRNNRWLDARCPMDQTSYAACLNPPPGMLAAHTRCTQGRTSSATRTKSSRVERPGLSPMHARRARLSGTLALSTVERGPRAVRVCKNWGRSPRRCGGIAFHWG
jgi:hypothetical protein